MMMMNEVVELTFRWEHFVWALSIGALTAISLPMGTFFGLTFRPSERVTGLFAAFGAGALFAALSVELVAPTVAKIATSEIKQHPSEDPIAAFWALIIGATIGGSSVPIHGLCHQFKRWVSQKNLDLG